MRKQPLIATSYNHASDALSNNRSLTRPGERLGFREAIDLIEGQCDHELRYVPEVDGEIWTQQDYDSTVRALDGLKQAALVALSIYERLGDEEFAAQEMQISEDEQVQGIGRALASGDYSELAI